MFSLSKKLNLDTAGDNTDYMMAAKYIHDLKIEN